MKSQHKQSALFTGPEDQRQYHQGLRSTLGSDQSNLKTAKKQQEQQNQWNLNKQGLPEQPRKLSADSFSDDDLSSLPVEKQFETDYDQTGHLVPDTLHFDKEQDMVGASNDKFHPEM